MVFASMKQILLLLLIQCFYLFQSEEVSCNCMEVQLTYNHGRLQHDFSVLYVDNVHEHSAILTRPSWNVPLGYLCEYKSFVPGTESVGVYTAWLEVRMCIKSITEVVCSYIYIDICKSMQNMVLPELQKHSLIICDWIEKHHFPHTHQQTSFSPSNDSFTHQLTIQPGINAGSFLVCFCCGLFLRLLRHPRVLGSPSNGSISPWQEDSWL